MNYTALDERDTLTDDHLKTSKAGLHEFLILQSAGRARIADVLLLVIILLLFNTKGADVGNTFEPDYNKSTFCIENHLLPSIFVIGIQKCGTTTLSGILKQFKGISDGLTKEHHYFDNENNDTTEYYSQFPRCTDANRTYDKTPNYTNPDSSSAANIKAFYEKNGIPLEGVSFIAMVCQNFHRLRSAYYHHVAHNRSNINDMSFQFNKWFKYIMLNQQNEQNAILRRGFYDEIFDEYFHTFAQSSFLIIDSFAAFREQQALRDTLSDFLNLKRKTINKDIWKNRKKQIVQEELNEDNTEIADLFYENHEKRFVHKLKQLKNVETFPKVGFFGEF